MVVHFLDIVASQQLFVSSHVRERDKGDSLEAFFLGVCGMDFYSGGEIVPCRFCGGLDGGGHSWWE